MSAAPSAPRDERVDAPQRPVDAWWSRDAQDLMRELGAISQGITFEVTEGVLMERRAGAFEVLGGLQNRGFGVALDDFGTGYSSLVYLKALPLDYLKIDSKLAQDIAGSTRDRIVVRGVIDMARSLGLDVIAEGVETEEQLTLLAREGCTYYQGFLCSEPLTASALERLVEERALT